MKIFINNNIPRICRNKIINDFATPAYTMSIKSKDVYAGGINSDFAQKLKKIENISADLKQNILRCYRDNNKELANFLCFNNSLNFQNELIPSILNITNQSNQNFVKRLCIDNDIPNKLIPDIIFARLDGSKQVVERLCFDKELNFPKEMIPRVVTPVNNKHLDYIFDEDINKIVKKAEILRNKCIKNPDLYLNGMDFNPQKQIEGFFKTCYSKILVAASVFDLKTLNVLLRQRTENAVFTLNTLYDFSPEKLDLLKKLSNLPDKSGKLLNPKAKLNLIDYLKSGEINTPENLKDISGQIGRGYIDINELWINLLKKIVIKSNLKFDSEINKLNPDKLLEWDLRYIPELSKVLLEKGKEEIKQVVNIANSTDFKSYISDVSNIFGKTNKKTKDQFKNLNLDYGFWINTPKSFKKQFVLNTNSEYWKTLNDIFTESINMLKRRNSGLNKFIDKKLAGNINSDDLFEVPKDIQQNPYNLCKFIKNTLNKLVPVRNRAKRNLSCDNVSIKGGAQKVENTFKDLDDILKQAELTLLNEGCKPLDFTLKIWGRIPQKDLFQGNLSECCMKMSGSHDVDLARYHYNTAFNMLEIVDNTTGNTIGNALLYFIKTSNKHPILVVDNIEISPKVILNEKQEIKLRDNIFEYLNQYAEKITGKEKNTIFLGENMNDLSIDDLPEVNCDIKFIGELKDDAIYLDALNGNTNKANLEGNYSFLKLIKFRETSDSNF